MAIAAWTYALIDTGELKTYLNISSANDADNNMLQGIVNRASQEMEQLIGQNIISRDYTDERYSGDGKSYLLVLRQAPVTAVTSLYDDCYWDFTSASLIDSDYYYIWQDEGIIERKDAAFANGRANIKVTYTAGWGKDTTLPRDIRQKCLMLAAHYYMQSPAGKGRQGQDSLSLPGGQGTSRYVQGIPKEVYDTARAYRRIRYG